MRSLAPMFGVTVRTPPVGAVYTKNKMVRMVRYHFGSRLVSPRGLAQVLLENRFHE